METLCERHNDGKIVKLWWSKDFDACTVTVDDVYTGKRFVVFPPSEKALDAFYHPYAYQEIKV